MKMPMPPMEDAKSVKIKVKYDKKDGAKSMKKNFGRPAGR